MTFKTFENIVKEHRPEIQVFQHGSFFGSANKVAVIFNPPNGRVYEYTGSYCSILNRLGINAVFRSDVVLLQQRLETLKNELDDDGWEDFVIAIEDEMKACEEKLERIKREFVIIE